MAEEFPFPFVAPVDPNLGRRVDKYFVLRKLLGRGGMGAAYLAEHEALPHIKCVIKLVLAELARHPMAISRVQTETEAVSLLRHDGIVKLHNFGVLDDGQLFSRFEFIDGVPLDRYVTEQGGILPLRKVAYIIFQLCDALQYAHDSGVIHRDLKPDNVMVEMNPKGSHLTVRVKILDFGIAKVIATTKEHTASGVAMGTPRYMAPEQVTNAASATGRADVFSMAVIFYLIVTGKLPWGAPESDIAIYHKQKTEAPAWPAEELMPADVAALVMRALSIDPERRPTMHEFAVELACAILDEGPGFESGTEILGKVVPAWVTSSPHYATTLPRPATPDPTAAPARDRVINLAQAGGAASPSAGAIATAAQAAARIGDMTVTANASPRARAASAPANPTSSAAAIPTPRGSSVVGSTPPGGPAALARLVPTPVIAAFPTGLASQEFAAQLPPSEERQPSVAVASEIEVAAGTPGPAPYQHAEVASVVVSPTQLPELVTPGASADPVPLHHVAPQEPAPFLVLPNTAPPRHRRKLIGVAAMACVLGGVAFAVVKQRGSAPRENEERGASPDRRSGDITRVTGEGSDARGARVEVPRPDAAPTASVASRMASPPSEPDGPTRSPDSPANRAPPTQQDVPSKPSTVNARPIEPMAPDAGPVSAYREKKLDPPARSPDAPASGTPVATTQRQPAAETASGKPARVDSKRTGKLTILVTPWALVWLDGKPLDQAPVVMDDVPAGRHRLRLKNDIAKKDETTTVTVTAGQTTTVQRTW